MTDDVITAGHKSRRRSNKTGLLHFCPLFIYLLIFYIVVESFSTDVRAVLFTFGTYRLSWVEVFYILAGTFGILEMLKVSEPRVDNTMEALFIAGASAVYGGLFLLGATGARIWFVSFSIFSNTEFLVLTILSAVQFVAAFLINSRTLQLQIADTR